MSTTSRFKCDHEENREKVCAVCGNKIVCGSKPRSYFLISKDLEKLIQKYSNGSFKLLDSRFPKSICGGCRIIMNERKQDKASRHLPKMPNYEDIVLVRETRSHDECSCYICEMGRFKGQRKTIKRRGAKKECKSIDEKILRSINMDVNNSKERTSTVRNSRVILNSHNEKPVFFSEENLDNFIVNTGVSLYEMKNITNFIQANAGKKSVPPYYRDHASKKAKVLEDVYECGVHDFDVEKQPEKQKRPVVYADAETLLDAVLETRAQCGEVTIKIMADGGGGFFKMSMTILPKDYSEKLGEETSDADFPMSPPIKKRSIYAESGNLGNKSNLNGVNRLIMICVVPNIKESYDNVRLLWNLTNLNKIPFKFVSDYKLLLIIIGQQTATSSYPCPFCFITLKALRSGEDGHKVQCFEEKSDEIEINEECKEESPKLKTFGDIKVSYQKYSESGSNKKLAKNYHSIINLPLFDESDEMPIIEKVVIPELHEIQGIVNHIFFDGLVPILGRENAFKWPNKMHLTTKNYQGEKFEGNACRRLLKEADNLNDHEILQGTSIFKIIPFIQTLKSMDKLVDACFSSRRLDSKWKLYLKEFEQNYRATGISITLKVHVLFDHLGHGLHFLDGDSLGLWSEQAGESVHRIFMKYWAKYQINDFNSENYCKQLKKAVVEFSSRNL